jgi:hypothetical protein
MDDLVEFIDAHCIANTGLKLLANEHAVELVEISKTKEVKLGGFDGFYIRENGIQIESSLSRDYSKLSKRDAEHSAIRFFNEHRESKQRIGYELVFVPVT